MKKKKAFTLAEVLITLGIIGIVAAMTLPTIIQKQNEKATVARLKKAYTIASQGFMSAVNDNGTIDQWNLVAMGSDVGAENFLNKLVPYFKFTKVCGSKQGCLADIVYKDISGKNSSYGDKSNIYGKARLSDGTFFYVQVVNPDCSSNIYEGKAGICGGLYIDINGTGNPNQYGVDLFVFHVAKNGVLVPGGDTSAIRDNHTFEYNCLNKTTNNFIAGGACTAWVLFNENMDYLHCNDLSWDGKHSCK